MTQTKITLLVGGIIAALLAAVLIVGLLIFNSVNAAQAQQNYEDCMARYGFQADAPPNTGGDEDAWLDAISEASSKCSPLRD